MFVGAGIGAIAGTAIGAYMDKQEKELREKTAGTDVEVIRQGDELLLNMPSGITFDTDSYSIKPEFRTTLDNIASTLGSYNQTYVDVYGHTDSRSEEHTSELQSLMRISYAVFCLKKKNSINSQTYQSIVSHSIK